jgi:hypothetical protein
MAVGAMGGYVVSVDSDRSIRISKATDAPVVELTAHRDSVLGVRALDRPNHFDADYFTWACAGSVLFWDLQGKARGTMQVELEQLLDAEDDGLNELRVVRASSRAECFVSGDRYGVMR